jgi:hypothetical protein
MTMSLFDNPSTTEPSKDRRERWTDTWVRVPGGLWQCIASQQT